MVQNKFRITNTETFKYSMQQMILSFVFVKLKLNDLRTGKTRDYKHKIENKSRVS